MTLKNNHSLSVCQGDIRITIFDKWGICGIQTSIPVAKSVDVESNTIDAMGAMWTA